MSPRAALQLEVTESFVSQPDRAKLKLIEDSRASRASSSRSTISAPAIPRWGALEVVPPRPRAVRLSLGRRVSTSDAASRRPWSNPLFGLRLRHELAVTMPKA